MLDSFIYNLITRSFGHTPTADQEIALKNMSKFIAYPKQDSLFLLKGFAGTGKSSLVGSVVKAMLELKQKIVLLTPTGRAAKVFSKYAEYPTSTIHRKIFRQKSYAVQEFSISDNLHVDTLFIVDEASMIANNSNEGFQFGTGRLLDDLIQYVYAGNGCRLMLIGDSAQLPPVGYSFSPALERNQLEGYGLEVTEVMLTQVVRQAEESGILSLASNLRMMMDEEEVYFYPPLEIDGMEDVKRVPNDELIEKISTCYDKSGIEESIVVCRSNKTANIYNKGIRGRILYREEEIESGERLMIVRNNYFWKEDPKKEAFIANGDIVELIRIRKHLSMYGFHFADVTIRFVDYDIEMDARIILDGLLSDYPALSPEQRQNLFNAIYEDYALNYRSKAEIYKQLRIDPWLNSLQVKYAYAMTCHKAQGGQWENVFVDQGYLTEEMLGLDYYRWLYTAFTRATKNLYLVNFADECFEQ